MRPFLLPLCLLLTACANAGQEPPGTESARQTATNPDPAHSSRVSVDWQGTYRGILPCADCEGIETVITLLEDGSYQRSVRYLGREDYPRRDQGEFEWDDAGGLITLDDGMADGATMQRYRVGENRLFHLDRQGQRVSGDLADRYVLEKDRSDPRLEGREWVLTELFGEPVSLGEGQRAPTLAFDGARGRVTGSDGCNRLMGSYRLFERDRIEFSQLASTMMACPDMTLPDRFRDVLDKVGDYAITNGELSLFKGRTAIMARFREAAR
jgi:heat shock protein HslJ